MRVEQVSGRGAVEEECWVWGEKEEHWVRGSGLGKGSHHGSKPWK